MATWERGAYRIDTDPALLDTDRVFHWLSVESYWARGRARSVIERGIAHSINFGVYHLDGPQVGYARIVTDEATFAWLCDVYVDSTARGQGLGTWLAETVVAHLASYGVRRILLATNDAHGVYVKAGFAPLAEPTRWMELTANGTTAPDGTLVP
jgi:GNAT superfamily N-acetyltransferase